MAERYTSLIALVLDRPVEDVGAVVSEAQSRGTVDRHRAVGDAREAAEILWGGRMQKAVARRVTGEDGAPLLRVETYIGGDGLVQGMSRQAQLLEGLAAAAEGVVSVRDLSAASEHDLEWLRRVAAGEVTQQDAITVHEEGRGTIWVHSHGAGRFDIPDLELYGLNAGQVASATEAIRRVHSLLLRGGLRVELSLADGTPVYLVPVREAWQKLPLDWPGVGRAGQVRHGHEGPRASLSVLHPRRFGRYRLDLEGVIERL